MYKINEVVDYNINCGFELNDDIIMNILNSTNSKLDMISTDIYSTMSGSIISGLISHYFCKSISENTTSIVNPISNGRPDMIPENAKYLPKKIIKKYHTGLEIKCTSGMVPSNSISYDTCIPKINDITSIEFHAHHNLTTSIMCVLWDCVYYKPMITAIFLALFDKNDWNIVSECSTCSTTPSISGKEKLIKNWAIMIDIPKYVHVYNKLMTPSNISYKNWLKNFKHSPDTKGLQGIEQIFGYKFEKS